MKHIIISIAEGDNAKTHSTANDYRHLIGSAEVIIIINRYWNGQSYTKSLELEAALCILPVNISSDNNVSLHMFWGVFYLNEETPSGSGTTHSTHGIAIQRIASPDNLFSLVISSVGSQSTVSTN